MQEIEKGEIQKERRTVNPCNGAGERLLRKGQTTSPGRQAKGQCDRGLELSSIGVCQVNSENSQSISRLHVRLHLSLHRLLAIASR